MATVARREHVGGQVAWWMTGQREINTTIPGRETDSKTKRGFRAERYVRLEE